MDKNSNLIFNDPVIMGIVYYSLPNIMFLPNNQYVRINWDDNTCVQNTYTDSVNNR